MSEAVPMTTPLADWLSAAASRQPVPGGGSVAAVAGALAAAMGAMTLRFSQGRKANTPDDETAIESTLAEMDRGRLLLLRLAEEDQTAYAALRADKNDATVAAAIAVPQAIMATALALLDAAVRAAPVANPWLLSDLQVCGDLATAAVRCGSYNVLANLGDLDAAEAQRLRGECDEQVNRAVERVNALTEAASRRRG